MISKEQFLSIISHFSLMQDLQGRIDYVISDPLYDSLDTDFMNITFSNPRIEQDLVDVLEDMFKDESHWISYFIYDLQCGVDWHEGMIIDKNGNDIPLGNAYDLWNLLIEELINDK